MSAFDELFRCSVYFEKQGKLIFFSIKVGKADVVNKCGWEGGKPSLTWDWDKESQGKEGVLQSPFDRTGERPHLDFFSRAQAPPHSLRSESVCLHGGLSVWIPEGRQRDSDIRSWWRTRCRVKRPLPSTAGWFPWYGTQVDIQTHRPGVRIWVRLYVSALNCP